ncbi:MAG: hypothetical protein KGD58_04675 [Candidatus Lokiarchaeota archaeon]|nr:hypothetical protein [Candidatus Lokiarchaeota archaeon]
MSNNLIEFTFKSPPKMFTYIEGEPLKITEYYDFFHNKSKIRKSLIQLQYLFKSYTKTPLLASGIRDTYLKEEYSEHYLMILFTTPDIIKDANKIIEIYSNFEFTIGKFLLITTQDYLLLLAKDIGAINSGVEYMEEILKQILEDYFAKKDFEDFIKVRQFSLSNF